MKEFPWSFDGKASPPCGGGCVCSGGGCGSGNAKRSFAGRIPKRSLGTTQRGGALLLFVLKAVAGACVGRWTGQPRMPPQERQHEGL